MYTKEEIVVIKNNLKKIEDWVVTYIVPSLRKSEYVSVDFGEWKTYPSSFCKEQEHSFCVSADGTISYRSGGLVLYFDSQTNDTTHGIYDSWSFALDLFQYWGEVKNKLHNAVEKTYEERERVLSFKV